VERAGGEQVLSSRSLPLFMRLMSHSVADTSWTEPGHWLNSEMAGDTLHVPSNRARAQSVVPKPGLGFVALTGPPCGLPSLGSGFEEGEK